MFSFTSHNKALSDKISVRFFLVECPIESCYVCRGIQLNSLAKKAPGGRSLDMIIYSGSFGEAWEE